MKKLLLLTVMLIFISQPALSDVADEVYAGVSEGQTIFYSYLTNKWYYQEPNFFHKKLSVTRYITEGSGSYSEYVSDKGQVYYPTGSVYEFLYNGQLITYHNYDLKFFKIIYNTKNKSFVEVPLSEKTVRKIMGNPEIIRISEFNIDKKITVKKSFYKTKNYLLLNDTDKYFYRYSLDTDNKHSIIKNLFWVKEPSEVVFSHYIDDDDNFPSYKIEVKNSLKF